MKKLLRALCLLLALVFLFAACNTKDKLRNDSDPDAGTPPTEGNPPTDDDSATGGDQNNGSSPVQDPALLSTEHYKVTAGMMSYMVYYEYQKLVSYYSQFGANYPIPGSEGGNPLDRNKPLREQKYGLLKDGDTVINTSATWFDYFAYSAKKDIYQILACCEDARLHNVTLDHTELNFIESQLITIESYAPLYGYTTSQYIKALYGECTTLQDLRSMLELMQLASKWGTLNGQAFFDAVDDTRIEDYYQHNQSIYNIYCDFTSYTFITSFTPSSDDAENAFNAAKYQAEQERFAGYTETLSNATDYNDFKQKLYNILLSEERLQKEAQKGGALTENEQAACAEAAQAKLLAAISSNKRADDADKNEKELYNWLFASTTEGGIKVYLRKAGDIGKFEQMESAVGETDGTYQSARSLYTVAYFNAGMHRNEEFVRSVGHILFMTNTFDNLTSTSTLTGSIKEIADKILARDGVLSARAMAKELLDMMLKAGDITEQTRQDGSKYYKIDQTVFERYGELYTEDSNVFYNNVYKGQMVQEFEDWLFDEDREEGEISYTDPVKTAYGYHIMYYTGNETKAWKGEIRQEIAKRDYSTWLHTILNATTYTNGDPTLWDQIK